MNCIYCDIELICSSSIDIDEILDDFSVLTFYECPKCKSSVEVYKNKCVDAI